MEEAPEKTMDSIASFKSGKSITITGRQYNVCSEKRNINLLVSSNRYGYIFYATENDGLTIIPSAHIDRESRYLTKSSEDDDDDDNTANQNPEKYTIIHRSYIPDQSMNKNTSTIIPHWISLNADETILAVILFETDTQSWLISFYDVVKLIQIPDSAPVCPQIRLKENEINGIQNFAWNPAIPNIFAYIDGNASVSTFEIVDSKQVKLLGKCNPNDIYSSICWSPKGKQIVVVTYEGGLDLFDQNMAWKKNYPSAVIDSSFPPCISVLWISNHHFLLGFSEDSPDETSNPNAFTHVMVAYEKDQVSKTKIYYDFFFDSTHASPDTNSQLFYARINETKIIICGLSKSLKLNVFGPSELDQNSLDIWTFGDQFRATIKSSTDKRSILTGMTINLNSTLLLTEGNKKLPPCPVLLLTTDDGILQVYYFIHKDLPQICRLPEELPKIRRLQEEPKQKQPSPSPTNGFSFTNFGFTTQTTSQPKETSINQNILKTNQPLNGLSFDNPSKPMITNTTTKSILASPSPQPSPYDYRKLLQMINEFQTKLKSLEKPLSKPSEASIDINKSLESLTTTLNNQIKLFQTSTQSIKSMTSEHIESMTKIENARHHIKLSQKENLYHLLKDRELDPWTQSRLDSIKIKYDKLKHDLNVLLQLTHTTIHDRSFTTNDDEAENEDFLPNLEISLNTSETMKHRIQKRILELSHKVSETEKDLQMICSKLDKDILSSKISDSTFTKTTMSSDRPFHSIDAQILSYLQDTHKNVRQIKVPSTAVINLTTIIEQKKPSTTETTKPITPSIIQPTTPKQANSPSIESESFKNMLRIVKTSIDIFSGATSPEQLQELSNTIATSPLSSTQRTNLTSINKTPTISKTTNISKTSTVMKPSNTTMSSTNLIQTPAKSVTSSLPTISVTPATPAAQTIQQNKPIIQTPTDLSRTQTMPLSGDGVIRSLLNTTVSPSTTIISTPAQPVVSSAPNQVTKPTLFGTASTTSAPQILNQSPLPTTATAATTVSAPIVSAPSSIQSPFGNLSPLASTNTTSVQSTSPTTKPIVPTGGSFSAFGSKPTLGGPLNLSSTTSSSAPFGTTATITNTGPPFGNATATTPTPSPFGSGTSTTTTTTTATTSTPSTGIFGTTTSPVPSQFGSGFGTPASTTVVTSAPSTGIFSTATSSTSRPSTGAFGASPAITSPFGNSFGTPTSAATTSPFGSVFGTTPTASTGVSFGGFGGASTTPTSTASTSVFGGSGFGSPPTLSAASVGPLTTGTSLFGGGGGGGSTSSFGSNFSGFGTQPGSSGASTGFSFGGFGGAQPSDATPTQSVFGSFGSPSAVPQASSPFGAPFGGAPGQPTSFGASQSSFGAQSTQSASSPSFTTYRK